MRPVSGICFLWPVFLGIPSALSVLRRQHVRSESHFSLTKLWVYSGRHNSYRYGYEFQCRHRCFFRRSERFAIHRG